MARLDPGTEVDPELRRAARFLPGGYALHRGLMLPRMVMGLAGRMGRLATADVVAVSPDVTVRVHRPVRHPGRGPALLWLHGGGMIMGSAAQEDQFCRKLVNFTDVAVVAVDYRLAPEHPYPTPVQDCYTALRWLTAQPWVDRDRVAIGGASAGGGLTATLAQCVHDRAELAVALQMMVYPMLDDRTGTRPEHQRPRVMWSADDNQRAWQWYLGGADPTMVAPARRDELAGLPPAWIGVGALDLFYDECLDYGARLTAAGVPTHVEVCDGAFHAFDLIAPNAAVSQRFFASQCRALRSALVDPPSSARVDQA